MRRIAAVADLEHANAYWLITQNGEEANGVRKDRSSEYSPMVSAQAGNLRTRHVATRRVVTKHIATKDCSNKRTIEQRR